MVRFFDTQKINMSFSPLCGYFVSGKRHALRAHYKRTHNLSQYDAEAIFNDKIHLDDWRSHNGFTAITSVSHETVVYYINGQTFRAQVSFELIISTLYTKFQCYTSYSWTVLLLSENLQQNSSLWSNTSSKAVP